MATLTPRTKPKKRPLLAATLLVVAAGVMAWVTRFGLPFPAYLLTVPIMGLLQWLWWRNADPAKSQHLKGIIAAGILAHLFTGLVANHLYTSDDINRYVFEGHVVSAGGNPYREAPASPLFDELSQDSALETIRQGVNNSRIATIYPPVAEFLFALGSQVSPDLGGWIFVTLVFDTLLILLLPKLLALYDKDPRWIVVYAFHPLVLLDGIGGGHVDLVAVTFLVFSILALKKGDKTSAWVFFALSALSKVVTLIVGFSLLVKAGWKGMIVAGFIVFGAVAWCYLPGKIVAQPQDGTWKIIGGIDQGKTLRFPVKDGTRSNDIPPLVTASGRAMVILEQSAEPPRSQSLLHHSNLKACDNIQWNDLLGQYRIVAFSDAWKQLDGKSLRFDGQGRLKGAFEGRYWIDSPQTLALSHGDQVVGKFFLSEDFLLCAPQDQELGLFLVKVGEKIGMGFRHYGSRWVANAPIFRTLESFMPGPGEYDIKRKQAQKIVAALLLIFALIFAVKKTLLPTVSVWLFFALWISTPAVYPWYLLWLVPFLPFCRSKVPLVLTYSGLAMHLSDTYDFAEALIFGPVVLTMATELLGRMKQMKRVRQ